ncbi:mTERF domain-containing mitochondrial isoform A [Chlorella sorokiniana]|uniref:mTERF domain-containing mitochondrial isoform A n=1 Tax=Chlorella sorokiniana TaxID=3076 RepID=A0A2P6TVH9_CHLSO|nr:mTERF domain-containing mitochondrial isoform A [Chlorella sorokiniana]|eukprot:PRW58056.1 mTERF domain-containing mitochondrial isoform A [Chlorella sorokiniana]
MLRSASRRLSALQPTPELPLAAQGGSSLLLLATLRGWSSCSWPLHAAAPSSAAAAAAAAATSLASTSAPPQQPSSGRSYSSSSRRSSDEERPGSMASSGALLHPMAAASASLPWTVGRRCLHWGSPAAEVRQHRSAGAFDSATRSLLAGAVVSKYLQERLRLSEKEADAVVARIQTFGSPESQCYRRGQPRDVSLEEVAPVVDFLIEEVGGADVAGLVRNFPHILVDSSADRLRHNYRQLAQELQLTPQQMARMARRCPLLLRVDMDRNVLPTLALLRSWGVPEAELRRLAVAFPSLFMYRSDSIETRLNWLHEAMGLSRTEVCNLLRKFPVVATYSSLQHEQGRRWLLQRGMSPSMLPRAVSRFPQLITYSEHKRNDWLGFMRQELGLSQAAVTKVLVAQPDILGRSLALLRKHAAMWQERLLLSDVQLRSMLEANPGVLRLDVSSPTYASKIDYLRHLLQGDGVALAQVLSRHPYFLSYRVERIVTRGEYLRSLDRLPAESPTGWLSCTEPLFVVRFAKTDVADFEAFKQRFMASPDAKRLLSSEAERTRRMGEGRLKLERAVEKQSQAQAEHSLRLRIKALETKDARLAAAEAMLQQREEQEAQQPEQQEAEREAQQRQPEQQQRKLPRLGSRLPDFSQGGWTAAAALQLVRTMELSGWQQAGAAPGADQFGNASLLQLLQQQAAMAQQQQAQQHQQAAQRQQAAQARPQQAGVAGDSNMNLSLAALLAQQPAGAAAGAQQQFPGFGAPQQPAGYGFQPSATAFAGQAAVAPGGMAPSFLSPDLLQQQMAAAGTLPGGSNRSGSGSLPPAILQHQQAALARQAAAGAAATLPGVPPVSVASNGFGPEGQQPAWGAMPLPAFPLPLAGFGMEQQPVSSTAAGLAGAGGAAPGGGAAPQPKRRGRQPRDPSTLTEKQLRAREAQKRFRDKQKRMMAETEAAVGQTTEELQRLRVSNESQKLKNEVLERLLQYKEAQVHALELQKQMDPPPRFVVSADMVEMMRREGIAGLFTPEVLLRYAVAGYTEHMDERGEVKEPPPFEKVASDWGEIVSNVRHILDAARQGSAMVPEPAAKPVGVGAELPPGARAARPSELVELKNSDSHGLSTSGSSKQMDADGAGEVLQPGRGEQQAQQAQRAQQQQGAAALAGAGSGTAALPTAAALQAAVLEAATATSGGGSTCSADGAGMSAAGSGERKRGAPVTHVPENVHPEVAAIAEEAPEDVLEAAQAKDDPVARFVLARILSQTAAHSHLEWDTLVDGATVQSGPETYCFTGKQLRALAHLMRRVGLVLWQQALLFPQHITKLGTVRLDDPNNLHVEEQNVERWRGILRRLHCREEQLHKIVAGHQRYISRMRPVLEERKDALDEVQRMTEAQLQHNWSASTLGGMAPSSASFVQCTQRLTEATGLVMQTVSAQHAAYCELLIAIFYALTFPVQRPQLFVLSWPYFPQLQLIGRAAALELGIDISTYPTYSSDHNTDF